MPSYVPSMGLVHPGRSGCQIQPFKAARLGLGIKKYSYFKCGER